MKIRNFLAAVAVSTAGTTGMAVAQCSEVSFADVGWTAETATTELAATVLEALGYDVEIKTLAVPVTYASMETGDIDLFLGNWMPSMAGDIQPYLDNGTVIQVRPIVEGAKYTLATNAAGANLGIRDFSDISKHAGPLEYSIIGIEPGNDGNRLILDMIDVNQFNLADFELKESSEQGMLAEVARRDSRNQPVVFLGWAPHPMNNEFDMTYLTGGDDIFGPDFGAATVWSNARAGYLEECPNVGQFMENLAFSVEMEQILQDEILNKGVESQTAGSNWLRDNLDVLDDWLDGVTTIDGGNAKNAVVAALN